MNMAGREVRRHQKEWSLGPSDSRKLGNLKVVCELLVARLLAKPASLDVLRRIGSAEGEKYRAVRRSSEICFEDNEKLMNSGSGSWRGKQRAQRYLIWIGSC
jgi:hypothetical protein